MTKKELKAFRVKAREVVQLKSSLEQMKDEIGPKGVDYSAPVTSHSGEGSLTETAVERYIMLEQKYLSYLAEYTAERLRIEAAAEHLSPNERAVIRSYYLDRLSWEETAYKLHFSYQHIHRLHASALIKLEQY